MYILGVVSGALALLVSYQSIPISLVVLAIALLAALAGIAYLERAPYERQQSKAASAAD
jgi:disulfide bond formation protein DsbB